jgi:hypothetical protein
MAHRHSALINTQLNTSLTDSCTQNFLHSLHMKDGLNQYLLVIKIHYNQYLRFYTKENTLKCFYFLCKYQQLHHCKYLAQLKCSFLFSLIL